MQTIIERLEKFEGNVGFYYKNLQTQEIISYHEDMAFQAASVIKIPVMIELFRRFEEGSLKKEDLVPINPEDKLPPCGALTFLHNGIQVTLLDICTLMIVYSDNTATNILIRLLGIDQINQTLKELNCEVTRLNRFLFDEESSAKGIQNYISPIEISHLLELMYQRVLISPAASDEMLSILKNQQINSKLPFFITDSTKIAHKTGEDDGITHDVGIVFTKKPYIIAFCSEHVLVPKFERFIQDVNYEFALENGLQGD